MQSRRRSYFDCFDHFIYAHHINYNNYIDFVFLDWKCMSGLRLLHPTSTANGVLLER
jgi:hypothetical protein